MRSNTENVNTLGIFINLTNMSMFSIYSSRKFPRKLMFQFFRLASTGSRVNKKFIQ